MVRSSVTGSAVKFITILYEHDVSDPFIRRLVLHSMSPSFFRLAMATLTVWRAMPHLLATVVCEGKHSPPALANSARATRTNLRVCGSSCLKAHSTALMLITSPTRH